jgi:hypothetical protein
MTRSIIRISTTFASLMLVVGLAATPASAGTHRFWAPVLSLPTSLRAHVPCIMMRESHSTYQHLNLGDNNRYGSSGIFQMEQATFAAHQLAAGVPLSVHVWEASPFQQELVFVEILRVDGTGPWSRYDGC